LWTRCYPWSQGELVEMGPEEITERS
jgi:hypothetical protein